MLKTFVSALSLITLSIVLNGCGHAPFIGGLYSEEQFPVAATANPSGNRVGEACAFQILGLVATGDASIEAARRNGGISMISSVDQTLNSYLFVYAKSCTIVRGR
jgi:hypothetical protein